MIETQQNKKYLSSFALKWIAMVSMVLDHAKAFVFQPWLSTFRVGDTISVGMDSPLWFQLAFPLREVLHVLGRIAFPIYCFLIAEGFAHSRDKKKYALRLGIFALISEIPFNYAHYQKPFCFELQNVMFTLFVSVLTLLAVVYCQQCWEGKKKNLCIALSILIGMGLALLIRSEYVFFGVLSVCSFYLLRKQGRKQLLGVLPLVFVSPWVLLAVIPLWFYNGERGKGSKYFFYAFYPVHYALFALAAYWIQK